MQIKISKKRDDFNDDLGYGGNTGIYADYIAETKNDQNDFQDCLLSHLEISL